MEAADNVSCLSALFNDLKDEDDEVFANAAGQLNLAPSDASILVGHVAKTMQGIELSRLSRRRFILSQAASLAGSSRLA